MRKKQNKRQRISIFSFLLISTLIFPQNVLAAEKTAVRTQTFTSSTKGEKSYQKHVNFERYIKEDEKDFVLKNISFEIVKESYLDKKEKVVASKPMDSLAEYKPKQKIKEASSEYTLIKTEEIEKENQEAYQQSVTSYDDYNYAVSQESVPAIKTVKIINEKTGVEETVPCYFASANRTSTELLTNQISIVYEDYDASYYEWDGHLIPKSDDSPALAGYEEQLLADVAAPQGSYITGIRWAGESYSNENGVLCRNAVAEVERQNPIYRVTYQGEIKTEAKETVVHKSTYEAVDKNGRKEYEVKATASYVQEKKNIVPYVIASTGVLLLLIGIISVLLILAKRKKDKENGTT